MTVGIRYKPGQAGLPLVHEMMNRLGVPSLIRQEVRVKEKGWREDLLVESIVGLVVNGGEHLSDIEELRADSAYQTLLNVEASAFPIYQNARVAIAAIAFP